MYVLFFKTVDIAKRKRRRKSSASGATLCGHMISEDANLPVKSVLGGQIDFQRDKVGDTDSNALFVRFFSLCDTLMLVVPWEQWEYKGIERKLKICLCLSKT